MAGKLAAWAAGKLAAWVAGKLAVWAVGRFAHIQVAYQAVFAACMDFILFRLDYLRVKNCSIEALPQCTNRL